MITRHFRWAVPAALAASIAWAAHQSGGMLLAGAWLALLCVGLIGFFWFSATRRGADLLHDPAVSTLVFPPESKFEHRGQQRH